jgi:hypothetical protein
MVSPNEEPLHLHEDLVVRYGSPKEAVAALIPAQQILASSPAMLPLRAFILLGLSVCDAWRLFILFL